MIKALTGTSLIEYPGKISSIVFLSGCNLYCPYCHNPELVRTDILKDEYNLTHDQVLQDLKEREGFIEAVTLTGGEPLLYGRITELAGSIKSETGLSLKIDTNGTFPQRLKEVSEYADFVAMDLKSSPEGYPKATGERAGFPEVEESIHFILKLPMYEFRTTMVPGIVSRDDVVGLMEMLGGVERYVLQTFHSRKTLSSEYKGVPAYPKGYLEETAEILKRKGLVNEVSIRL